MSISMASPYGFEAKLLAIFVLQNQKNQKILQGGREHVLSGLTAVFDGCCKVGVVSFVSVWRRSMGGGAFHIGLKSYLFVLVCWRPTHGACSNACQALDAVRVVLVALKRSKFGILVCLDGSELPNVLSLRVLEPYLLLEVESTSCTLLCYLGGNLHVSRSTEAVDCCCTTACGQCATNV